MIHLFYLRSLFFLGIISFVLLLCPPFSSAKINIEWLLRKLDSSYYYPQKHGLINISAKYEWEQQDFNLGKKNYIKIQILYLMESLKMGIQEKESI